MWPADRGRDALDHASHQGGPGVARAELPRGGSSVPEGRLDADASRFQPRRLAVQRPRPSPGQAGRADRTARARQSPKATGDRLPTARRLRDWGVPAPPVVGQGSRARAHPAAREVWRGEAGASPANDAGGRAQRRRGLAGRLHGLGARLNQCHSSSFSDRPVRRNARLDDGPDRPSLQASASPAPARRHT